MWLVNRLLTTVSSINGDNSLFVNTMGRPITKYGLNSSMQKLKKKMVEAGRGEVFWTLHMLKHRGMTDAENKNISGHVSESMKKLYDHSLPIVQPAK